MNKFITTAAIGLSLALTSVAAQAQAPAAAAPAAAGKLSVKTTPISDIIKNEKAKAALEKMIPEIAGFYDQIGPMTLADVAPMSQGALDDAKLAQLQAEFDKL